MAATPAWSTVLKVASTGVAVTGEACTVVTGNTYQINTTAKRAWDPAVTPIAYDGGVPATISSVDFLFGKVTLAAPPGGAVTVDVTYLPLLTVAEGKSHEVAVMIAALDASVYGSQDSTFIYGLRTLSASISTLDTLRTDLDSGAGTWVWDTKAAAGTSFLVEMDPGGIGTNKYRFWCFVAKATVAGAVDALITGDVELQPTAILAANGQQVTFASGA